MLRFGKEIASASLLGRGVRHTMTAAPLAGLVTFTWGKLSTLRGPGASHGFFRLYARKSKPADPRPASRRELEQDAASEQFETPAKDSEEDEPRLIFGSRHMSTASLLSHLPWGPPAVSFDLSKPTFETEERGTCQEIYRLSGYTSDSETIKIHFEQQESPFASSRDRIKLSKFYLRDICQSSSCICPSTGKKAFATFDVPDVPRVLDPESENIRLSADGSLEITWKDDFLNGHDHTSVYPENFLNCLAQTKGREKFPAYPRASTWDAATFERGMDARRIGFNDWMEGGAEFAQAILNLHEYGLVFIHGVPRSEDCVRMIAEKIGHLQCTPRGLTWDDISEPGDGTAPFNGRLHQDMLYLNEQPQVQFLHCLENESLGSASLFSNGLHCAEALKMKDYCAFLALSTQLVNYRHREPGQYFLSSRHVIRATKTGSPGSIAWSPAFQGPFSIKEHPGTWRGKGPADGWLRDWSRAARAFRDELESPENVVVCTPEPGDCIIFDSRRILHGSEQLVFPAGCKRLRGAYVDKQTLRSAFVGLVDKGLLTRRVPGGTVFGSSSSDE